MTKSTLKRLQDWYATGCDGGWEHQYGVQIDTLDNPGWEFGIDLEGTALEGATFADFSLERNDDDWVRCRIREGRFEGFCGAENLEEALVLFLDWADGSSGSS